MMQIPIHDYVREMMYASTHGTHQLGGVRRYLGVCSLLQRDFASDIIDIAASSSPNDASSFKVALGLNGTLPDRVGLVHRIPLKTFIFTTGIHCERRLARFLDSLYRLCRPFAHLCPMATSSSRATMPVSEHLHYGIELTERKSAQFGTREVMEPQEIGTDQKSAESDDLEDITKSTNIDRHDMERMGKRQRAYIQPCC